MTTNRAQRPLRTATRALIVPAVFPGMLGLAPAANSAPSATDGICTAVVNQTAHRGTVQENLLRAAARRNAELITKLQTEKAALQTTANSLTAQIAVAKKQITDLDAANAQLDRDIEA